MTDDEIAVLNAAALRGTMLILDRMIEKRKPSTALLREQARQAAERERGERATA